MLAVSIQIGTVFCYYGLVKTDMTVVDIKTFDEMYSWLLAHSGEETELYARVSKQKPEKCIDVLCYTESVKAALCFGWIDSTLRNIDGMLIQRFSPRKKNSHWTETNIKRCIELDEKGLLREEGKQVCPYFAKKGKKNGRKKTK